jgi:hypothetical protein
LIDETQQDELLIIDSYLNFMQNRTGLICDGYADITKCTRDDFVKFTKWTHAMDVVYDEEEASVAQDRDAVTTTMCRCMLPAYGMLPTLQVPNLYGLPKDKINCSSHRLDIDISIYMEEAEDVNVSNNGLLRVKWGCAASNIQRTWRGWYVRHLIKRIRSACIIQRLWRVERYGLWSVERYVRHPIERKVGTNTNSESTISPDAFDALLMIYQYLNDISIPEVETESDGDSIISSNGGDSGNDAPTIMEDVRGGILSDTSGVGLFRGSGLNDENVTLFIGDENTVQLLIGDKNNLNLPIEPEPDNINIINTEDIISVSNTEVKIDAARQRCNVCSGDTAHDYGWYARLPPTNVGMQLTPTSLCYTRPRERKPQDGPTKRREAYYPRIWKKIPQGCV